jgi:small subunit ribosomal protein S20
LANHKSALKRARQSQIRRLRNLSYKTRSKHAVKQVRAAVANGTPEEAREKLLKAVSILQKTSGKGVIHKRAVSRRISRLSRQVNQLASA